MRDGNAGAALLTRVIVGALLAASFAAAAARARSLTISGAMAATVVGTVAVAAGWGWATLLLVYFISSSLLSKLGASGKASRTAGMIEKHGARDAWQVVANGGVFAACALVVALTGDDAAHIGFRFAAAGALGASAADTWATEIGMLASRPPRSMLTWRRMSVGESGGVSLAGWLGALAGAATVAGAAVALTDLRLPAFTPLVVAGILGATVDSLAGAMIQHRRWCDTCGRMTEMHVHSCGTMTRHLRGLSWVENDAVNFLATLAAAVFAFAVRRIP